MTTLLFLDDERVVEDVAWVKYPEYDSNWIVRSPIVFTVEVKEFLLRNTPLILSFDHDLQFFVSGVEVTGYDALKEICEWCIDNSYPIPVCYFHTMNNVGKTNMESYYNNAVEFQRSN